MWFGYPISKLLFKIFVQQGEAHVLIVGQPHTNLRVSF